MRSRRRYEPAEDFESYLRPALLQLSRTIETDGDELLAKIRASSGAELAAAADRIDLE